MSDTPQDPGSFQTPPLPEPEPTPLPSPSPSPSPETTGLLTPDPPLASPPPGAPMPPNYVPVTGGPTPGRGTNGLAIAALVLGILWLCAVGSVLAIVFGFIALNQIKRSGQSGRGLAIAGVVIGIIGVLATVVTVVALLAAVDEVFENQPDEFDDVELIDCGRDAEGRGVANLEITNDSAKRSSYIIAVEFEGGGNDDVGLALDPITGVEPGETRGIDATSTGRLDTETPDCRVSFVERFATE